MNKKVISSTIKTEMVNEKGNDNDSVLIQVENIISKVKTEVAAPEEEDQSNWKPGQKYPTPSPGSGGNFD
jgi:hypothetical protein